MDSDSKHASHGACSPAVHEGDQVGQEGPTRLFQTVLGLHQVYPAPSDALKKR